jgi:hypothetical protein
VTECPREADAFEAVAFGRWPAHVTRELLAHVAGCSVCRDVVDVAAPLQDDRRLLMRAIDPPGAGIVWWRATIRARAEATRTVMQPMTMWQAVAATCVAVVAVAFAGAMWRSGRAESVVADLLARFAIGRSDAAAFVGVGVEHALILVAGVVACIVLAPVALYLALGDD